MRFRVAAVCAVLAACGVDAEAACERVGDHGQMVTTHNCGDDLPGCVHAELGCFDNFARYCDHAIGEAYCADGFVLECLSAEERDDIWCTAEQFEQIRGYP